MGVAIWKHRVSHTMALSKGRCGGITPESMIEIMTKLPPRSLVVGIELQPITALSLDFHISIDNEMFIDGSVIDEDSTYKRQLGFGDGNKMIQFNSSVDYSGVLRKPDPEPVEDDGCVSCEESKE